MGKNVYIDLKPWLEVMGMTQSELADALGVGRDTVSRWAADGKCSKLAYYAMLTVQRERVDALEGDLAAFRKRVAAAEFDYMNGMPAN